MKYEKLFTALVVFIFSFSSRSADFYHAWYHEFPRSITIEIFVRLAQAIVLTSPVIASAIFFGSKFTRFVAGLSILFSIYTLLTTYFPNDHLEINHLFVLIVALLSLSALGLCYLSDRAWQKGGRIILIVVLAWGLSPLLLAALQSDQATYRTFTVERVVRNPPKAVVVLVLDEMSPELVPLLRPAMTARDHILHVGYVQKAGKDTINAIPSMLTPRRHDGLAVCGATRLCGGVFFDMAKLRASRPDTDVVGFYHPYCAILGLRSCWKARPTNPSLPGLFNVVTAKIRLVTGGVFPMLKEPFAKPSSENLRQVISKQALNAPLWSAGGGMLYVHQYLPHPDGVVTGLSLNDEYHIKMSEAVQFVSLIRNKLQRNFGEEYLLIVTSDHPLRSSMWCGIPAYESASCLKENFPENNNVPFMVLAPQNVAVEVPTTNVGVFSPTQ